MIDDKVWLIAEGWLCPHCKVSLEIASTSDPKAVEEVMEVRCPTCGHEEKYRI